MGLGGSEVQRLKPTSRIFFFITSVGADQYFLCPLRVMCASCEHELAGYAGLSSLFCRL